MPATTATTATTAVTLLQATVLGRQSLAAGCSVRVNEAQARAWVGMGIARLDGKTASEPEPVQDEAQNMLLPLAPIGFVAIENVAQNKDEATAQAPKTGKTATQRKRGA